MILLISVFLLWLFYLKGGFNILLTAAQLEEKPPNKKAAAPAENIRPNNSKYDRMKLEKIARDCLTAAGCKFDTYTYCRSKSDFELMDIIKDYNIK